MQGQGFATRWPVLSGAMVVPASMHAMVDPVCDASLAVYNRSEMPGTDLQYFIRSAYARATRTPVLSKSVLQQLSTASSPNACEIPLHFQPPRPSQDLPGLSFYARATKCPVLACSMGLGVCYEVFGTDMAYQHDGPSRLLQDVRY
eukprot:3935159-Rhodomonas_salina.2